MSIRYFTRHSANFKVFALVLSVAVAPDTLADIEIQPNGVSRNIEIRPAGQAKREHTRARSHVASEHRFSCARYVSASSARFQAS